MPVDQELAPLPGHLLVNSRFTHVNKVFLVLGEMDVNDLTDELRLDLLPSRLSQIKSGRLQYSLEPAVAKFW